jgi:hypothetical protein
VVGVKISDLMSTANCLLFDSTPDKKIFIQAVSGDLPKDSVKCIQSLPNGKIDITLRNEGLARALIADGIRLNGTKVKPQPVGLRTTFVYVHYLPSELSTDFVAKELSKYGKVIDVKRQLHEGTNIQNGSRIVNMEITMALPSFTKIGIYNAKLWHRGQVPTNGFCHGPGHINRNCPERKQVVRVEEMTQEIKDTREEGKTKESKEDAESHNKAKENNKKENNSKAKASNKNLKKPESVENQRKKSESVENHRKKSETVDKTPKEREAMRQDAILEEAIKSQSQENSEDDEMQDVDSADSESNEGTDNDASDGDDEEDSEDNSNQLSNGKDSKEAVMVTEVTTREAPSVIVHLRQKSCRHS